MENTVRNKEILSEMRAILSRIQKYCPKFGEYYPKYENTIRISVMLSKYENIVVHVQFDPKLTVNHLFNLYKRGDYDG